jgi:single-stranded-DNA-specific exonuclease
MMPLQGTNRILAKAGFESIGTNNSSLLSVLLKGLNIDPRYLVSENIAFQVAPVINAAGRMGHPNIPFSMLTSRSAQEAEPFVKKMIRLNDRRKQVALQDFEKAKDLISDAGIEQDRCIIICSDFHEGILGITAARLVERYHVPALVCCFQPNSRELIKGSGRSPGNINLHECLVQCSDVLSSFGGHQAAAGFSLPERNFSKLQEKFKLSILSISEKIISDSSEIRENIIDLSLSDALDRSLIDNLMQLEPFGEGNPRPVFRDKCAELVSVIYFGGQKEHVRGTARGRYRNVPFIGFHLGEKFNRIGTGHGVTLSYTHMIDTYNGQPSWKIRIRDAWPARQA